MIKVTVLGNNSALPAFDRHPTAQVIEIREQLFLMDCGEGTQKQMSKYGVHIGHINHIFISHLHGDHYFGLIGLLSSMALWNRQKPVYLYAPEPLKAIIALQLDAVGARLPYDLVFKALDTGFAGVLLDTEYYAVDCFPVNHRVPCHGFIFREKSGGRKINPEACHERAIPKAFYPHLKKGEDYRQKDGTVVPNGLLTFEAPPEKVYAFCADTRYDRQIIPYVQNADIIYHESTFLSDNEEKAFARFHSTARQAAQLAAEAHAGKLLLGHYSSRYQDISAFENEAKTVFANSEASVEGNSYIIK
ncbi:MAG TPA: ribonuclease Z [Edaphocola sp.]|nr:ribonuclease Z [Edaphocola sp.]